MYLNIGFDFASFGGSMFIGFAYVMIPIGLAIGLIEDREVNILEFLDLQFLKTHLYLDSSKKSTSSQWSEFWPLLWLILRCFGCDNAVFVCIVVGFDSGKIRYQNTKKLPNFITSLCFIIRYSNSNLW